MSEVIIFLKACEAWDCVKVKDYFERGGDVNAKHDGYFALKYAAVELVVGSRNLVLIDHIRIFSLSFYLLRNSFSFGGFFT